MLTTRRLPGISDYAPVWQAMREFVEGANDSTPEELWLLQHAPVYTLGRAGKREHLLRQNGVPLTQSDRGGQITYHAPGQAVAYLMLNVRRRNLALRRLVRNLEGAVCAALAQLNIQAAGSAAAPGVYVAGKKIAALGLRARRGWVYHGVAVNVRMDLRPFADINPCGYAGLPVTQIADEGAPNITMEEFSPLLEAALKSAFAP